jgi:hypothetical protein
LGLGFGPLILMAIEIEGSRHGDRNVTAMKRGKTFITWSDRETLRMYASLVTEMLAC